MIRWGITNQCRPRYRVSATPNLKELDWAIEELEGQESSENRYMLLAALYTCRNQMLGTAPGTPQISAYSQAAPVQETLGRYGDSEFLQVVEGRLPRDAWAVMDELLDTLRVVNPRAYESVIRKLDRI